MVRASSSRVSPLVSVWVPVTCAVRRRSSRTGVLNWRWATLSRQHATATSTPAGRIWSALTK